MSCMKRLLPLLLAAALPAWAAITPKTVEPHHRLASATVSAAPAVALTLDACGGGYDADLIQFLIERNVPATVFVTRKWLARNPTGLRVLLSRPDLFEIEDHGAEHVPAVIGAGARVYGLPAEPDAAHLHAEVTGGADAIRERTGNAPRWYRGATARYDAQSLRVIENLGFRVAGFSVNADAGATLPRSAVIARVRGAKPGDVIIAHMNKPASQTAEGLSVGIAELLARGYRFVKLAGSTLIAA